MTEGWAPAYHKKEDATWNAGGCKYSLQYDGRLDRHIVVQVGMWNIGSLSAKGGEVCEEQRKRMIDVCCLQEARWRGQGVRKLGIKKGDIIRGGVKKEMV